MSNQSYRRLLIFLSLLAVLILTATGATSAQRSSSGDGAQVASRASDDTFRSSPVMFIENAGQWPEAARFQVWGAPAGTMWLAEDAIWITVVEPPAEDVVYSRVETPARFDPEREDVQRDDVPNKAVNIKLSFVGANPHPTLEPFDRLDTMVSYFIGGDPDRWRPDVSVWGGVRYVDLYPGVDLEIARKNGQMVQRLAAQPHANLSAVRLRVEGADAVTVEGDMLRLSTAAGEAVWPLLETTGSNGTAAVLPHGVEILDVAKPFVSPRSNSESVTDNPTDLLYGTYLGGSTYDYGWNLAVDEEGHAYVTGETNSANFPAVKGPGYDSTYNGYTDAFVVKLTTSGTGLFYATFIGGSSNVDLANSIVVDQEGQAYVTGETKSADFPANVGPGFDTSYNGDTDAFVIKLTANGTGLLYATFLGGRSFDYGYRIAVDREKQTYITGASSSGDFPAAKAPGYDNTLNGSADTFVVKLDTSGQSLVYATFLGGNSIDYGYDVAVDGAGQTYVTGSTWSSDFPAANGPGYDTTYNGGYSDAFVVKLNAGGTALLYATFLGGSEGESGYGIAVDGVGQAHVTGVTKSVDFPAARGPGYDTTFNGRDDAYVAKLNASGTVLLYGTFLGGSGIDDGQGIAVDRAGQVYITGETWSADFPAAIGPGYDASYNGNVDAYVITISMNGMALLNGTFLGGSGGDDGYGIALDPAGQVYVTGWTGSVDFPTANGPGYDTIHNGSGDAYVVKLAIRAPTYSISGRVTDASGHGIPGVTVWAGFPRNTTTDANGNYTFTNLPAGTYNLTAEKTGYAICPHSRDVTLPPTVSGQNFTGLPATISLGFCPSSDGYSFSNSDSRWGTYPSPPAWGDFTMEDTRRMCGDRAVCIPPAVSGLPCIYKPSALVWNGIVNVSMNTGHCAGMAATSLRFFKDIDQPSDFQAGVTTTFGLDLLGETRRNIAYYHVEQSALPILSYKLSQQLTSTPTSTLDTLRATMSGATSDPVLLVLKSGKSQHAVTPIALEDRGNGIWAVWVYDNALPGAASVVLINTLSNTWSRGSWSGNASSHSLYVIPMSLFNGQQTCPFLISPVAAAAWSGEATTGQIWLTENANLLITDSLGRRLGYVGDQLVSEIPGAGRVDFIGGTSHPAIPLYSIPLTETYTMVLDGQPLTRTQTLALAQFGPGYAAAVEELVVSPTTRDELSIAYDGSRLQYHSDSHKEATLTLAKDGASESYQFKLGAVNLPVGQPVTLTNNLNAGRLAFANSQGTGNSYDLAITRATGAAGVTRFYHADLTAAPGDVQSFDYGRWDGVGSLVMEIDHDGNGTIDETRILENQIKKIYLPLISRR